MSAERFKNTDSGPLHINSYTPANRAALQSLGSGATAAFSPDDYGATGARFVLIQVDHDSTGQDLLVEVGISGSVVDPGAGSMRIGQNYGMPYIQLPQGGTEPPKIIVTPESASTTTFNIIFSN